MKKLSIFIFLGLFVMKITAQQKSENELQNNDTNELKYIGMPVGGICAGQVYLGGDGQLWYWDIFNVSMLNPGSEGGHRYYENPLTQEKKFENGFGLTIRQGDRVLVRPLNSTGFSDVQFEGEYPIGKVSYNDDRLPISANLKAYTPFIPTDAKNSGLPVTILEYTVTNKDDEDVSIELSGWLQNMSSFLSAEGHEGKHTNKVVSTEEYTRLVCESDDKFKDKLPDWGSMSLTLVGKGKALAESKDSKGLRIFSADGNKKKASTNLGNKLVGSVSGSTVLKPGESKTFTFHLSWYFPNINLWNGGHHWKNKENLRHYYTTYFNNSNEVSDYLLKNNNLLEATKTWNRTWYNSSLPKWFLDRTFVNVSTLATTASVRFNDLTDAPESEGRFYTYEGVYLGEGTCTHVFHYEQAMGRVFPNLSRQLREQTDLGLSFTNNGIIKYRGEFSGLGRHDGRGFAIDGHAGTVMRIYREHLMSRDKVFLKKNWNKIKKTIQVMINQDKEKTGYADGILEGKQYNTLDRTWYGKITWISGLYAASLKAGAEMAKEMGDLKFSRVCAKIAKKSYKNISKELFNGEYFIQKTDPEHPEAPNTNIGCHTDQLLGQYWTTQTGLGDILPKEMVKKSLQSIMKYNFTENYGDYLKNADIPVKRFYADKDEQGIIMCTFPKGGTDKAPGVIKNEWEKLVIGYFSEVWTGQEHQLAATLISEGFVEEALKVERAVHDRYAPSKRNPYNEIEYGNHYTRAMSGYAPFVSASGFTYHGPNGIIGFDPKINPNNFKSAFIVAEGWGSFSQKQDQEKQMCELQLNYGNLKLSQLNLVVVNKETPSTVEVLLNKKKVKTTYSIKNNQLKIKFDFIELKETDLFEVIIK
ncbi:GH116 family glycosyl-hydrolase [Flavivirga spongiicola]|uniref:GH116 family glycosyl-hydrolase n=1 Tax=Flavivirga spongiicola TaxID=421621 RepID=A0ABU7XTH3_9FLAO|nr:GH116 family glycosyl-hydrolase [Flavivirga sp. MEBiC05379]MDO5979085.1 GH116 family glycosyl-hydrolase [Flavivirga sp. MEBiC05379]